MSGIGRTARSYRFGWGVGVGATGRWSSRSSAGTARADPDGSPALDTFRSDRRGGGLNADRPASHAAPKDKGK